jgi:hypothetical protein
MSQRWQPARDAASRARSWATKGRPLTAVDWTTAAALRVTSPATKVFTNLGPQRLPRSRETLKQLGFYPIPDHYYQPLFNDAHLTRPLGEPRDLPGIDWRHDEQLALLRSLVPFADELVELRLGDAPTNDLDFFIENQNFGSGDAEVLYSFIRATRPRRVFEIGSGSSTKLARLALERNASEDTTPYEHVCVEPYEFPWLEKVGVTVVRSRVEDLGRSFFDSLEAGDLLFIDSSHMIRPQGDVLFEFLELLPTLAPGVVVHIHDIFTPRDYPDSWVRQRVRMWNEQYLLEAMLAHSTRYQVMAGLNHLKHSAYDELAAACPYLTPDREPGSFYLRVV